MALKLRIESGEHAGAEYLVTPGLVIGRKTGTILLAKDLKVSSSHACIEFDNKGTLILRDLGSANGILLGERRVKKVALLPGVSFVVGKTVFKVFLEALKAASSVRKIDVPLKELVLPTISSQPPRYQEEKEFQKTTLPATTEEEIERPWHKTLLELLPPMIQEQKKCLAFPMIKSLQLTFLEGVQYNEIFHLSYGPRTAGFGHYDLNLLDPKAPAEAFEIVIEKGLTIIKDLSRAKVLLNKDVFDSEVIREGDIISFGETKIKVGFL